jgi:adenine-specific DNA-methyltransferase
LEFYSYVLNKNYIQNHKNITDKLAFIDKLNNLPIAHDGFIFKNYCMGSGSGRQYFSDENGKKIDNVRAKIKQWRDDKKINSNLYYFLLSSLLEAADKVANTASVYGAYLKHLKKSAQKTMVLRSAEFLVNDNSHLVFNEDSNNLIKKITGDILYLDPPYNHRQYGANYHLLNTIARYDDFIPSGKTGLDDYNRSKYCQKSQVKNSFENLIKNADFEYIFLSYNNEGLMSENYIKNIMQKYGKYSLVKKEYQRFKADKDINRKHKAEKLLNICIFCKKINKLILWLDNIHQ